MDPAEEKLIADGSKLKTEKTLSTDRQASREK